MQTYKHSFQQTFYWAIAPSLVAYIVILIVASAAGISPSLVLRDLLQTCEFPAGVGMISNLGILLWASSSAITYFTINSKLIKNQYYTRFLCLGCLFSSLLCLDDLFLLRDMHQLSQDILYTLYVLFSLNLLISFRQLIVKIDPILFMTTIILLGMSIISDIFQDFLPINYQTVQLFEEGFKFTGISCWLYFWSKVSKNAIKINCLKNKSI